MTNKRIRTEGEGIFHAERKEDPLIPWLSTHPEVGGRESVAGGHVGAGRGVGVVRVDVGQQGGHVGRNPGAQVLRGQAVEMAVMDSLMVKSQEKI